jgi:PLP dependent protein
MSGIASNIVSLRQSLPGTVKIIAVSKTRPVEDILEAYAAGQRRFGENRVQELLLKKDKLPADIEWHLIGHLQRNKVRSVISTVEMIQSVDSFRLLSAINEEAYAIGRVVNVLLQIHIASEETKFGFVRQELENMMESREFSELKYARICGLMGMATFTPDVARIKEEFRSLNLLFRQLREKYYHSDPYFSEISMGMSGDYETAVQEGSTMIRVGSLIFGERTSKAGRN